MLFTSILLLQKIKSLRVITIKPQFPFFCMVYDVIYNTAFFFFRFVNICVDVYLVLVLSVRRRFVSQTLVSTLTELKFKLLDFMRLGFCFVVLLPLMLLLLLLLILLEINGLCDGDRSGD